jgi:hypothetical protein
MAFPGFPRIPVKNENPKDDLIRDRFLTCSSSLDATRRKRPEMRNEMRSDRREPEKTRITVSGTDHNGLSFEEQTETIDLSSEGLSFYLNTRIFVRTFLSLTFNGSNTLGYSGKLQVLVVRIDSSRFGKQLVAVQIR